jgi:hypothetical protein
LNVGGLLAHLGNAILTAYQKDTAVVYEENTSDSHGWNLGQQIIALVQEVFFPIYVSYDEYGH